MPELSTTIHLVYSLSKPEKKKFYQQSGKQQTDKAYLRLYKLINSWKDSHENLVIECRKRFPGNEFNTTVNYLYSVLIKSLITLNQQYGTDEKLLSGIQEALMLFRKGIVNEGFQKLEKLLNLAVEFEKFDYCIIIEKLKLEKLNNLHFANLSEEELLKIQTRLRKHIQYELNTSDHASLYELLNFRYLNLGVVCSKKDKDKLNDLVFTEINLAGSKFQTFNLKKNHLLFQSVYFMMTGDHKSSLSTFYELNQLFESHRHLWVDSPIFYILHLKGILNNLYLSGQYQEMVFFIEKLEDLQKNNKGDIIQQIIYLAKLKKMLAEKDYDGAEKLVSNQAQAVIEILESNPDDNSEVLLYTSITYFLKKEFKTAARLLGRTIHLQHLPNKQFSRILKLFNLIVNFELHDFIYLSSGIRALERDLKQGKKEFLTENSILKLLKKYPLALNRNARNKLFQTTFEELGSFRSEPYEKQLYHAFDFQQWVESNLKLN